MNRDYGQLVLPSNIERNIAAPLDATTKVFTLSGLLHPETFKSTDGIDISYIGMFTVVIGDTEENNGLYILKGDEKGEPITTNINNWIKLQSEYSGELTTQSKYIVDAINEIRKSIEGIDNLDEFKDVIDRLDDLVQKSYTTQYTDTSTYIPLILDENDSTHFPFNTHHYASYKCVLLIKGELGNSPFILEKHLSFTLSTTNDNYKYITYAEISNEDAFNASNLDEDVNLKWVDGDQKEIKNMTLCKDGNLIIEFKANYPCMIQTTILINS